MADSDETPAQAMANRIRAVGEDPQEMFKRLVNLKQDTQRSPLKDDQLQADLQASLRLKDALLKAYAYTEVPWTHEDEIMERNLMDWFNARLARRMI